jgi:hypothetical protein
MPKPDLGAPFLPALAGGAPWLCIVQHWSNVGSSTTSASFHYFGTAGAVTLPVFAANIGADWGTYMAALVIGTYSARIRFAQTNVWMWDGAVLHTYAFNNLIQGTLLFVDWDERLCAMMTKRAVQAGKFVYGRWWSMAINDVWMNRDYTLNALGRAQFNLVKNKIFGPFTSQGTTWVPMLFTPRTTGVLLPLASVDVSHRLHFYNKRARDHLHMATGTGPAPSPTIQG